ncbi:MAG TPA: ABC transporter ATP-binding protein [Xanthobacteraceae bacterium]|jgi:NitT/TauT family transport system ATP-binding protein|nr:ABC transporter ATP-binding protein [Xanthobacteraceae bacterium]
MNASAVQAGAAISCAEIGLTYTSKRGTPVRALHNVDCRIEAGKVTAVIGPSGCGKSTLLLIMRGLLQPSQGRVTYARADGSNGAMQAPAMATVWQAFNLFPWRTVIDNVAFGLELAGVPHRERVERARRALGRVDLAGFEEKYPRQLSGGMRQRVGLARALVMDPEILLLDEPFGALDAQTRLVLQEQLAKLVESGGTTAVLVTHSIEEAILLADHVLVMTARPGRVAAQIPIELPRPRTIATTRDPAYARLFEDIYGLLRDEVLRAMATEAAS